jgi:hypothetical protein
MKTYSVLYAADVPHCATFEVQAGTADAATVAAVASITAGDVLLADPDWDNTILERIVHIEDEAGKAVANDVPLDNRTLITGSAVRDAIQYALECLASFKTDWIASHGLKPAVEKLEAAYAELRGAA